MCRAVFIPLCLFSSLKTGTQINNRFTALTIHRLSLNAGVTFTALHFNQANSIQTELKTAQKCTRDWFMRDLQIY